MAAARRAALPEGADMDAIIDVGGGLRAAYAAGAEDRMMEDGARFAIHIGVSAGSANLAFMCAGAPHIAKRSYIDHSSDRKYMGIIPMLTTGSYLGFNYIYGTLMNQGGDVELPYDAFMGSHADWYAVATDAGTGKPRYFTKYDMRRDDYGPLKSSSCLPVVDDPRHFDGHRYVDGALSDPIPIETALRLGAKRIVIVLTRPRDFRRDPADDAKNVHKLTVSWPRVAEALSKRAHRYNHELDQAETLVKQGRALIVAPESIEGMKTLSRDKKQIQAMYDRGHEDAAEVARWLRETA